MNCSWSEYRINQLHRQEKMREAEMHRLGRTAEGKRSNRFASILANLLSLVV